MKHSILIALLAVYVLPTLAVAQKADLSLLRGTGFFLDHSVLFENPFENIVIRNPFEKEEIVILTPTEPWEKNMGKKNMHCPDTNTEIDNQTVQRRTFAAYVEDLDEPARGKSKTEGVIIGTDVYRTTTAQVGIFAGYNDGFSVQNTILVGNEGYIGGYGRWIVWNGMDVGGSLAYGTQDYNALFYGKYEGEAIETSIELGQSFNGDSFRLRPLVALDYYSNQAEHVKSGDSAKLNQFFLRTGIEGRWDCTANVALNGNVYYSVDLTSPSDEDFRFPVCMSSSGLRSDFVSCSVGVSWKVSQRWTLFGGYQGSADSENLAIGTSVGW